MFELIISFLCGALFSLAILLFATVLWFYSQPLVTHSGNSTRDSTHPQLSKHLEDICTRLRLSPEGLKDESCLWFNLIVDFLFKELRDTPRIKRLVMKKVQKEFQELLFTKTEGRMLEQLTVREYSLGLSMPTITSASVIKVDCSADEARSLEEIEIALEVEYTGNCEIAIDADLLFNKAAYVAIKVKQVKGRGRLLFTRNPVTSWSLTFYEEPYLDLKVDSHFEGRDFPQLSSFIESLCRKYIRRKHTLPASKTRYKPFFKKHKPQDQLLDLYVHDHRLTMGELTVKVLKCSRLPQIDGVSKIYCTVGIAATPWKPMIHLWKTQWQVLEFIVNKTPGQTIGMRNRKEVYEDEEESNILILVSDVIPQSAAHAAGLKKGDVVTKVNNVKINSVKQVTRLINKEKGKSVLITVNRPPAHFSTKLLQSKSAPEVIKDRFRMCNDSPVSGAYDGMNQCTYSSPDETVKISGEMATTSKIKHDGGDIVSSYREMNEGIIEEPSIAEHTGREKLWKRHSLENDVPTDESPIETQDLVSINSDSASFDMPNDNSETTSHTPEVDTVDFSSTHLLTTAVQACKNPEWNEDFTFDVRESHNYLNICVWVKLDEDRGNLLIGHVTISLIDVALECLCTSSGSHQENYVLVAAEAAKAYASRAALQATTATLGKSVAGKESDCVYTGDIFLKFKHSPMLKTQQFDKGYEQIEAKLVDEPHQRLHHPFTPSEGSLPSGHNFIGIETDGLHRKCDICSKKIWVLKSKVQECQKCGLKCHKKCIEYCMKQVPCYQKTFEDLQQSSEGEFAIYEHEKQGEEVGGGNGHRLLDQHRGGYADSDDRSSFELGKTSTDMIDSQNKGQAANLQEIYWQQKPHLTVMSCSESENNHFEASETLEQNQNTQLHPSISKQEQYIREVKSLQKEIERINGLIKQIRSTEQLEISSNEKEKMHCQLVQYEDQLHPLKLLMTQLMMELDRTSEKCSEVSPE